MASRLQNSKSAAASGVLNPGLYWLLQKRFHGQVGIVHEGEAMQSRVVREPVLREGKTEYRPRRVIDESGEEYKVDCPFCGDTRQRLFINHMWGVSDPDIQYSERHPNLNLWMFRCMNEECQADPRNQQGLMDELCVSSSQLQHDMKVRPGRIVLEEATEAELPGEHWRLDVLARQQPGHKAITYLQGRGFDPAYLGRRWDAGYCPRSRYELATDRIIIPITMGRRLVGWQARYIGEWKKGMPPKYWSMPGMRRRNLAYNFDLAVQHQTLVIVEGPMDVWGFGPQAFGVIGKGLSLAMRRLLVQRLKELVQRAAQPPTVVIMLDPTQDAKSKAKGQLHHIEKLYEQLWTPLRELEVGLLKVYLPEGSDPGSLDKSFMRQAIRKEAAKQHVPVSFTAPAARSSL